MRRFGIVAAGMLLAPALVGAQPTKSVFEERSILQQPFDRDAFRAVRLPAWVEDTVGCGYTLSVMDAAARRRAAEHGVTLSEVGFVDPFYVYYDSKLLKRRSPHVAPGRLEKDLAEYQALGVRVLAVYPPTLQAEVYEAHPDWRRVATDTKEVPQVDLKKHPHGGMLCPLGPYGDFFLDVLAEILTRYPQVAAFSFDGLHHGGVCYCEHCRANYRKDANAAIPKADMADPAFRRYQHWADRRLEDLVRRMQARLKALKPDVALVTWTTNAGRYGHFLSIPRNMPARLNLLFDAPDQEFWLDETNRGASIVPAFANAYAWAVTNHRVAFSEPYLMSHGNPYGKDSFPPHEVLRRCLLAVTYGAAPSLAIAQPPRLQQGIYDVLDAVRRRRPWLTHKKPEPWAALVMSDNTRTFYGRSAAAVEERYLAAVFGAFRACQEEHLPVAVVNDWNLNAEDLARYKVLILPNTACLDAAQAAAVEKYVRDGGGLVASLDTSLFDAYGDPRPNFALADVLGVDHRGLTESSGGKKEAKGVFDYKQDPASVLHRGKLTTYLGSDAVTFKGAAVRVAPRGADVKTLATLRTRTTPALPEIPAVVARSYGKGRVVYLAAGLDAAYYLYSYPYQRLVLRHALTWAASAPPPLTVEAPMCVHATLMRQTKDGERLIVHLFNDVNTTAHHAFPNDDVPLREETLPIHDVRITFDPRYRFRRVRLEPDGKELDVRRTPAGSTVTVPRLDVHALVVGELE